MDIRFWVKKKNYLSYNVVYLLVFFSEKHFFINDSTQKITFRSLYRSNILYRWYYNEVIFLCFKMLFKRKKKLPKNKYKWYNICSKWDFHLTYQLQK